MRTKTSILEHAATGHIGCTSVIVILLASMIMSCTAFYSSGPYKGYAVGEVPESVLKKVPYASLLRQQELAEQARRRIPQKPPLPQDRCVEGEAWLHPLDLCIKRCPAGQTFVDGQCAGRAVRNVHLGMLNKCKKEDPSYRLLKVEELTQILGNCPLPLSPRKHNYCQNWKLTRLGDVIPDQEIMLHDIWLGEGDYCQNAFGQYKKHCAWIARFDVGFQSTKINYLRSGGYGSTVGHTYCVRERKPAAQSEQP